MRPQLERNRASATLLAVATVSIWGATFVATKVALQEVSPATIVWLRFTMGVVILGIAALQRKELTPPARGDWPILALLGFIGVAFHQWLQANGLQTAAATTTAWLVATTPVFIALLGWIALKERLNWLQWAGIAGAAAGVLLILGRGNPMPVHLGGPISRGDLMVMLSAPNWAVYTILSRRVLGRMSPSKMIFYVMLAGWMFITVWAVGFGPGTGEIGALSIRGWVAVAGLGVFGSGLAYIMYHDALHVLPASELGVFLNLEPVVTMLLAAPILGEPVTMLVLVGGAMIVGGIFLVNRNAPEIRTRVTDSRARQVDSGGEQQ
jgi:drug/metabolite transporter (DMT)-like permease